MDKTLKTMKTKLFIIATILLLCGQNLLYSQEAWQYLGGLSDQYLWKVYAQSPDTVYIAGASSIFNGQGMIAKSTNGGANWTKTYTATNNLLKDIAFYNKNIGFTIGEKGVILKTTNGGTNWQLKTSGTTQNLNAIALTGLNNIWAVGDGGIVIHSTDEGETWQNKDFSTNDNFNDIIFYNSEGYIVGSNLAYYKTINTGTNWNKEPISIDENTLFSIQKTSNNLYVTAGTASSPFAAYKKGNTGNWDVLSGGSGLYMINDGNGYSLFTGILTNGGENIANLNIIKNDNVVNQYTIFRSWTSYIDDTHSDIFVANDTMFYVISGNVLLKSSPDITDNLKTPLQNPNILTVQHNLKGSLTLISAYPIISYELINISGAILSSETLHSETTATTIDIPDISKGVYIIRTMLADKRTAICKWIKY